MKLQNVRMDFKTPYFSKMSRNTHNQAFKGLSDNMGVSQTSLLAKNTNKKVTANNLISITNISFGNVKKVSFGQSNEQVSENIAKILLPYMNRNCSDPNCPCCIDTIKTAILPFIQENKSIQMTMAGFPFKSISQKKCIGDDPDMAEFISLNHLNSIIKEIKKEYNPGAKLTIFNDGLMFTPIVVNPSDEKAVKYVQKIRKMIKQIGADENLEIKTIADFFPTIKEGQNEILSNYPLSISQIAEKAKNPEDKDIDLSYYTGNKKFATEKASALADGDLEKILIDRFNGVTVDPKGIDYQHYIDAIKASPNGRLSKKQKENLMGDIACDTIRRSKAWGKFIENQRPEDIRLSCHPQCCGSSKLGIYLTPEKNNWGTPWHLSAVEIGKGKFVLAKKEIAEQLGFEIVHPYYRIPAGTSEEQSQEMIRAIQEKR